MRLTAELAIGTRGGLTLGKCGGAPRHPCRPHHQHEHGREHQRAAADLNGAQRLAEDDEGEQQS